MATSLRTSTQNSEWSEHSRLRIPTPWAPTSSVTPWGQPSKRVVDSGWWRCTLVEFLGQRAWSRQGKVGCWCGQGAYEVDVVVSGHPWCFSTEKGLGEPAPFRMSRVVDLVYSYLFWMLEFEFPKRGWSKFLNHDLVSFAWNFWHLCFWTSEEEPFLESLDLPGWRSLAFGILDDWNESQFALMRPHCSGKPEDLDFHHHFFHFGNLKRVQFSVLLQIVP